MDRSKLYTDKSDDFMILAVEGNALPLKECIEKYLKQGKYKKEVDFSPVVKGRSVDEDFIAANIYGKRFCALTAYQHHSKKPNTSLACSGNRGLPLEFLEDFADTVKFNAQNPSQELILEVKISQDLFLVSYQTISQTCGRSLAARIISESLKEQQKVYVRDSKIEIAHKN